MRGNEWQFTQESSGGKKLRTDTHTKESRTDADFFDTSFMLMNYRRAVGACV